MLMRDDEMEFILEQPMHLQFVRALWLQGQREVNAVLPERLDHHRCVAGLDADLIIREGRFEFAQHRRHDVLAGGRTGANAQASESPFSQTRE